MTVLDARVVLGTASWGRVGRVERGRVMRQAWALGIRRLDTAPSYGFGGVEREVLSDWPGAVDTKVGLEPTRLQRLVAPLYPTLRRLASVRSGGATAAGGVLVAPRHRVDEDAVAAGVERLRALVGGGRVRTVWIHDPPSVADGLAARETVLDALDLSDDRCGLAWTVRPADLPPGVPLLLPYRGVVAASEESARALHWHGVVRFLRAREAEGASGSVPIDAYLAGALRQLPPGHRLVLGSYRSGHLDVLHRAAALADRAEGDPVLDGRLADVVSDVEAA